MLGGEAGRGGRGRRTPGIARTARRAADLVEHPFEIGLDEVPGAHVAGLLLAPHHLRLLEAAELLNLGLHRERVELLDPQEIDILDAALLALLVEIEIDLAGAKNDAADFTVWNQLDPLAGELLRIVPQHAVERAAGSHLVELRHHSLMADEALRRHQDQRLADLALELTAQDVKIVRRRGAIGDLHIVLAAHLQEALQARGGMLGALAFIAVGQQADEARHAQPFALAGGNELVEDDLGAVGEIAELRLPQGEGVRLGERIAVFEAQHRLLREHRIDDLVARLAGADGVEGRVTVLVLLVDQDRMALREGAALAVLAGQPDPRAVEEERAERQRLRRRPVYAFAGFDHLAAGFEETLDGAVDVEALRHHRDL